MVESLAADFASAIETEGMFTRRGNQRKLFKQTGLEFNRILLNPSQNLSRANELISDTLLNHVRRYFGAEAYPSDLQAWRNYSMPDSYIAKDLLSNHWHNDQMRSDVVKVYLALHDITEDHGPFHFIPRRETQAALANTPFHRSEDDVPPGAQPHDIRKFVGPKGSVLLVNTTHCLHRAGIPAQGFSRDLIEMRFRVSTQKPQLKWPQ